MCVMNVVCSGGQTTYGMTSAISLAGPTPLDTRLSKTLEDTLRSFDMFETDEQMALRCVFLSVEWAVCSLCSVLASAW